MTNDSVEALVAGLVQRLGPERVSTSPSLREQHGRDESWHPTLPPDVVVFPASTDEVTEIVRQAAARRVPVIPYGTGTSLEGQSSWQRRSCSGSTPSAQHASG